MKEMISEREKIYYDQNEDQWRAGKFTISNRRVLLAQWTLEAYNELHKKYSYLIVKGLSKLGYY